MTFADLLAALVAVVRWRLANGRFTERGLARTAGLSQPQMHNILKGARRLTPATADRLLRVLGLTIQDLIAAGSSGDLPRML